VADLELIDCGGGRRLERFGAVLVDRAAPMAEAPARLPASEWAKPDLRWAKGAWVRGGAHDPWPVSAAGLTLECRPAAGGQVGVFPEHAATWTWLAGATRTAADRLGRPPEVLSLFAYTGGASLACARAGGRVAHVDASRPAVAWARRNAELSGLAAAPVRWLVDDARAFVRRERRRGRRYDGVVLDPPTYGHGAGAWQIEEDLPGLVEDLAALVGPRPAFVVLSAHTPGYDGDRLAALVRDGFGVAADGEALELRARSGATLRLGAWARGSGRTEARGGARGGMRTGAPGGVR
jgi:23S rRNA (cytosine1962-C5)-methyltransferase